MIVRPPEPAFPWRPRALPDERARSASSDHRRAAARGREDADRPRGATSRRCGTGSRAGRGLGTPLMLTRCSPGRGPGRRRSLARRRASSLASTSTAPGTPRTPCAGFERRTGWRPTTGPTSARRGRSPIPCRARRRSTTRTGSPRFERSAPRTTTRRSSSFRPGPGVAPFGPGHQFDRTGRPGSARSRPRSGGRRPGRCRSGSEARGARGGGGRSRRAGPTATARAPRRPRRRWASTSGPASIIPTNGYTA